MTGLMISSMMASFRSPCLMASACCVETTTASIPTGRLPSYSTVTCDFPSGRRKSICPLRRTSESRMTRRCASVSGRGMSSSVSRTAYPNIRPWSPARVDRRDDGAGLVVETELGPRVPDVLDRVANDGREIHVGLRRDLPGDEGEPGRDERLAGHPSHGVVPQNGVEDRVGDLVGDLVRVTLGDGLGSEVVSTVLKHQATPLTLWGAGFKEAETSISALRGQKTCGRRKRRSCRTRACPRARVPAAPPFPARRPSAGRTSLRPPAAAG